MGQAASRWIIDVDLAPALGEIDVLLGREVLISEENHRIPRKGILKLRHHGVAPLAESLNFHSNKISHLAGTPVADGNLGAWIKKDIG